MLEQKEALFKKYYALTKQAVESTDFEQVARLVEDRYQLISQMDELDASMGEIKINESIKETITQIQQLEKALQANMLKWKEEASRQILALNNAKRLRNSYDMHYQQAEGIFYDKRK